MMRANDSSLQLCNGNGVVDYQIPKSNSIVFKIKSARGCSENDALTALYNTAYYRNFHD